MDRQSCTYGYSLLHGRADRTIDRRAEGRAVERRTWTNRAVQTDTDPIHRRTVQTDENTDKKTADRQTSKPKTDFCFRSEV